MNSAAVTGAQREAEIARLSELLHVTERQLEELTAGEVDTVANRDGHTLLLRRAQEAMRSAEADRQVALLNALPAQVALLDAQGRIVSVNDAWRRSVDNALLPDPGVVVGRFYAEICNEADANGGTDGARIADGVLGVLSGQNDGFAIEYPNHSLTDRRWFLLTVTPLEAGRRTGAIVMHMNITAWAEAELKTRRSAELLQAVADGTPDVVYVKDTQGRYLLCNQSLADFTGLSIEQIVGKDDHALYPPEDAVLTRACEAVLFESGIPQTSERMLTGVKGARLYNSTKAPYRDEQGRLLGLICIARDVTDRKNDERRLLDSQSLLGIAGRLANVGGWSVDVPPTQVVWTDILASIHDEPAGFSPTMQQALDYYVPEHAARVGADFARCVADGTPFDLELQLVTARGRSLWVRAVGEAVRDENGVIRRIQGALHDLTERKQAELQTSRLAVRLTDTLESITSGFFTLDRDWCYTFINGEAERLMKRSRHDLLGRVMWEAYPKVVGTSFESCYRRAMAGEAGVSFEAMYEPWGMWIGVSCHPSAEGMSVSFQDVTAQRAERKQLELLQSSVSHLNDIVLITDVSPPGPRIVFVNDAFTRVTGYSRAEVMGKPPRMLHGPLTDPVELARVRGAIERFEPVHAELLNYHKGGRPYWVELDVVPVGMSSDVSSHFVCIQREINDRKRDQAALGELNSELEQRVAARTAELTLAREQADTANRAKSSFLATMSHEIRTPMNGVVGMIDVLEQSSLRSSQVEVVKTIRESAYALLRIVDDILDFSKIEAGQFQIDNEPMNPASVVQGVCGALDQLSQQNGVHLRMFTDPRLPTHAIGDAARLRQVLINLVGNAIKFCGGQDRQGLVSVRASLCTGPSGQPELEVDVVDNGIGMNPLTMSLLFQPFIQADAGTTRRFGGTGLGLSISNRLVEMMGGAIGVTSRPGTGSSFIVRLPLQLAPEAVDAFDPALVGLPCLVLGPPESAAEDLAVYLAHAGALVEHVPELAAVDEWLLRTRPALCVVVIASPVEPLETTLQACRASHGRSGSEVSFVIVEKGRRRRPRSRAPDVFCLDGDVLHRETFLSAVAVSSGRAAIGPADESAASFDTRPAPLEITHAAAAQSVILVAEDNEINQKVLRKQLSLLGFRVDVAANGREALALLRSGRYALLLTDLHMPQMDGYALATAVRADEAGGRRLPIVALTANAMKGEARRCLQLGMDDYMTKPIQLAGLRAMLLKWLPERQATARDGAAGNLNLSDAPRDSTTPPADVNVLKALVGNDPTVMAEVLELFGEIAARSAEAIRRGIDTGVHGAVVDAAHQLKSNARSVGALKLGDICADLEQAAEAQDATRLDLIFGRFETESKRVIRFLARSIEANGGPSPPPDARTSRQGMFEGTQP